MKTVDITYIGLIFAFLLILVPLWINKHFNLKISHQIVTSVLMMSIQLFLVGFFLEYIFEKNLIWLNLLWLAFMIFTAVFSTLNKIKIKIKIAFLPVLLGFLFPTLLILFYFNFFILRLDFLFDARYLIALGGMILGNILSLNIVAVNSFYKELKLQEKLFFYRLAMGASLNETLVPFIRHSFQLTFLPMLAKTATMGIVTLPGMMSGQIIGGASPNTAIRYQIAIMIAIFTSGSLSALLTLFFSIKKSFNKFGVVKNSLYKAKLIN